MHFNYNPIACDTDSLILSGGVNLYSMNKREVFCISAGLTVVTLRARSSPVPPSAFRSMGVTLYHGGDESSVAD